MNKPKIAITTSYNKGQIYTGNDYLFAIYKAGGIPVFVPRTTDNELLDLYARDFDGFLFAGGVDVDPVRYGETKQFDSVEIDEARDVFELAVFNRAIATGKPIFGICRGIQLINVALGGTLYQHMEGHMQPKDGYGHTDRPQHINVVSGSLLEKITKKSEFMTNTYHHQNVKELAPSLESDAVSDDGYIECLHAPGYPFLMATQWHPEIVASFDENASSLFDAFVGAAKKV